jgi:hypothetical protein
MACLVPPWALPALPGLRHLPSVSTRLLLPTSRHQGTQALPSPCLLPSWYVRKPQLPTLPGPSSFSYTLSSFLSSSFPSFLYSFKPQGIMGTGLSHVCKLLPPTSPGTTQASLYLSTLPLIFFSSDDSVLHHTSSLTPGPLTQRYQVIPAPI